MAGMQDYFAARNAVMQTGERRREERRLEDQMAVRQQAGNALASGDLSGASNALFQGGDLESGLAVQNAARTRQTADRDRQRSALAAAASGLLYVPESQRAAMFQNTIRSRLVAEGVPEEVVNQITPDMLTDAQLRGFAASLGGDIQDAPTGYRWGSDGQSMQYIPGGPADPQNRPPTFIPGLGFVDPLVLRQYMGGQQPQATAAPEYVDQLPPGVRPRPNQAPSARPAAGGAERSQPVSVRFNSSQQARAFIEQLVPGVRPTSGRRTPEEQRRLIARWEANGRRGVRPADNSYHLQDRAWDLVPPAGMSMSQLAAKMRQQGFRALNEGSHVHVSW